MIESYYGLLALDAAALDVGPLDRVGELLRICDAREVPTLEREGETDGLLKRLDELDERDGEIERLGCERETDGLFIRLLELELRDGDTELERFDDDRDGETL